MRAWGWFSACTPGFGLLLIFGGCFVDPGPISAQSEGSATTMVVVSTATTTATTTTTSAGTSTTGSPRCDGAGECEADEICVDGLCMIAECEAGLRTKPYEEPAIMLVIDKSRSMVTNLWDHDGDDETVTVSRWNSVHTVISDIAGKNESTCDFGLKLFPDIGVPAVYSSAACEVSQAPDIGVSPGASASLGMILPDADATSETADVAGGSPTGAAISAATEHLKGLAGTERARFILMVTDGSANCRTDAVDDAERFETYDETVLAKAEEAVQEGVEVGVLGIEISSVPNVVEVDGKPDAIIPSEVLSMLATVGGVPPDAGNVLRNATDEGSLRTHVAGLIKLMRCTVVATPPPGGATLESILIDGLTVPPLAEGNPCDQEGWRDLGGGRVRLCGVACSDYLSAGELELGYTCE